MDIEQLLKPRYKVIADYPFSAYTVGQIILIHDYNPNKDLFKMYPHLFKPLQWWEERKESDMPQYVKDEKGQIQKVLSWSDAGFVYEKESNNPIILPNVTVSMSVIQYYQPATEAEYNKQNQKA